MHCTNTHSAYITTYQAPWGAATLDSHGVTDVRLIPNSDIVLWTGPVTSTKAPPGQWAMATWLKHATCDGIMI